MKETEQTLLDQIKDQVAREKHNYKHFRNVPSSFQLLMMDEIADRYATAKAKASCEATLIKASENAKWGRQYGTNKRAIMKSSITDPNNITIA